MKQHITKEQWDEFIKEKTVGQIKFYILTAESPRVVWSEDKLPSIGEMIEFLGDDWYEDEAKVFKNVIVRQDGTHRVMYYLEYLDGTKPELADALWEVVKEKLK